MYDSELENLIKAALTDGELTDKERAVLMRRATSMNIDPDEFEMVLDARLYEARKDKELHDNARKQLQAMREKQDSERNQAPKKSPGPPPVHNAGGFEKFQAAGGPTAKTPPPGPGQHRATTGRSTPPPPPVSHHGTPPRIPGSAAAPRTPLSAPPQPLTQPQSQPKKCHFCGARLERMQTKCPSCGKTVDTINASNATEQLSLKLEEARRAAILRNGDPNTAMSMAIKIFPLPSGRADLFDIINYLDSLDDIRGAKNKRDEAARRAVLLYRDDDGIIELIKTLKIKV